VSALADECRAIVAGEWADIFPMAHLDSEDELAKLWVMMVGCRPRPTVEYRLLHSGHPDSDQVQVACDTLAAALLELHRRVVACGLPWPWSAPQVDGVRPAGWGAAPTWEEMVHEWWLTSPAPDPRIPGFEEPVVAETGYYDEPLDDDPRWPLGYVVRHFNGRMQPITPDEPIKSAGKWCAIDAEGRFAIVDTRGGA